MDCDAAVVEFTKNLESLNPYDKAKFLCWIKNKYFSTDPYVSNVYFELRTIAEDIKTMLPVEAMLPSEQYDHSVLTANNTPLLHVDSFLLEDEHIDALVEEGKLSRNYCKDCRSLNTAPITFISHSTSIRRVEYIFKSMLPDLTDKVVLDVGSRLGAMLYGAYYCSNARKIIGVELNADFCKLQNHIVEKYNLKDRIEVLCSNIVDVPDVVQSANVMLFHNVFTCFIPKELQGQIWQWLKQTIKPGTFLVTVPSIADTLSLLQTDINIQSWLQEMPNQHSEAGAFLEDDDDEESPVFLYIAK